MRRTFTWKEDRDYGGEGFIPDWIEQANLIETGALMAHDVLEHPPFIAGHPLESELMAYGAIIQGRYRAGMLDSYMRSHEAMLGSEVAQFFRDHLHNGSFRDAGRTKPIDDDEFLHAVLEKAQKSFLSDSFDTGSGQDAADIHKDAAALPGQAIGWLRRGYRWAERTYGTWGLSSMYQEMSELGDKLLKRNKGDCEVFGGRLVVNTRPNERSFTLQLLRDEGDFFGNREIDRMVSA